MLTAMNVLLISGVLSRLMIELQLTLGDASFLLSVGFVGMFFGALLFGRIADIIGRKMSLIITILIHAIFTALCGTTHDFNLLLLYRFLAGIGLGGALPIPGVYISEYIPAKKRGLFVGLVETAWVWGTILSLLIPLLFIKTIDWEGVFLWGLIAVLIIPFVLWKMPESIRYLEEKGKTDEAMLILKKSGLISEEKIEIGPVEKIKISWKELFSKKYLKATILLMSLWFILVYTYYGVFLFLPKILSEKYELLKALVWSLIIIVAQIPGYYSAAFLLDKVGRKEVIGLYLFLAAIGSLIVGLSDFYELGAFSVFGYEIGLLLFLGFIIVSFFNLGAWSGLYTYTPELYPTEYRGTGSGVAAATGRVAGILAPIITGYLLLGGTLLYAYVAFFLFHVVGSFMVFLMGIETKGKILEEIHK